MKMLLALMLLALPAVAQENYVVLLRAGQFKADVPMTLNAGECFPFIRWEPGNIWAVLNVHGYEVSQPWDAVRVIKPSKEVEERFQAAIARLDQEHAEIVAALQAKRIDKANRAAENEALMKWYAELNQQRQQEAGDIQARQQEAQALMQARRRAIEAEARLRQLQNQAGR